MTAGDLVAEFDRAWSDPRYTKTDLPPVHINKVLRDHYKVDPPLTYTRTMLWDMEVRKASAPDFYIPSAVRPDSARKWESGVDNEFTRVSTQRLWQERETFGLVIEHVHLDPARQSVVFIGAPDFTTPDGEVLTADTRQPLFHVDHWVEGDEDDPINRWRIVHLTGAPDPALAGVFDAMAASPYLRDFVEVHIRTVLGRTLTRVP
ncbi:hypothetical protein [Actinocrispum sp. NPDC049592]|uniref:hypothetical protein n=1 Tax=Actinocrispum sp. NPDC049592 TaxID=3154835 RepID=UPI00344063B2